MPSGTAGTPPVLWHNGGAPGCPFNSGDINAVEATASAVYIGGHLTNLCTVKNTSYTVRCPGALTVRTHVAALDPATGVPLAWNPGASGTRGVLTAEALPAGLAIGGDFQGAAGRPPPGLRPVPGHALALERHGQQQGLVARPEVGQLPRREEPDRAVERPGPLVAVGHAWLLLQRPDHHAGIGCHAGSPGRRRQPGTLKPAAASYSAKSVGD
jgi:hypothetical protein